MIPSTLSLLLAEERREKNARPFFARHVFGVYAWSRYRENIHRSGLFPFLTFYTCRSKDSWDRVFVAFRKCSRGEMYFQRDSSLFSFAIDACAPTANVNIERAERDDGWIMQIKYHSLGCLINWMIELLTSFVTSVQFPEKVFSLQKMLYSLLLRYWRKIFYFSRVQL